MHILITPENSLLEKVSMGERIECVGICHKGPIDESPRAIRYAKEHDPEAPAAFLLICTGCDAQLALCAKKVDSLLELEMLGKGYMKCNTCNDRILIENAMFLPIL